VSNALVSIQIIPSVPEGESVYEYVDAAIAVIKDAGVKYEVHPLETTMEGNLGDLMDVIQKMNDRMVTLGAGNIISQIKILYQPDGIKLETLTEKYR